MLESTLSPRAVTMSLVGNACVKMIMTMTTLTCASEARVADCQEEHFLGIESSGAAARLQTHTENRGRGITWPSLS